MGINYSVNLEINNHEYKTVNYTIDIWLINQTTDSGIINWTWDFGDGKVGYGEFVTHQYVENGSYIVNLTVKDYDNAIDYIEQTIFVGNKPPVANNDTATVIEDTTNNPINVLLNDFEVDGDDIIIVSVSSPSNGLATSDGSFIYYTPNPNFYGSDQFIYTIFDGRSETSNAIVTINVTNINDPPVPGFTYERNTPSTEDIIYFTSTSFDSDGYIVNWTWDFGDGNLSYGELVRHRFIETGSYIVNLTIKDIDNVINSIEQTIIVRNNIPVADFYYEPSNPHTASVIRFSSTSSDSDSEIVNWTWDFGDGNQSYGELVTHQYTKTGSYIVNLTVKDYDNATDSIEQNIIVRKKPPIAEFNFIPRSPSTTDIIYFKSTSSSANVKKIIFPNMWFLDKLTTTQEHTDIDIEKPLIPQWKYNYSFIINRSGTFKLAFLLFTTPTDDYMIDEDYQDKAENILTRAYRELHLWVDVHQRLLPEANYTYLPKNPITKDNILFTSNSTSINSSISSWKWDFGDGNISYGETIGLKFDGINDYVDCGINESLQPVNGTLEAWINGKDYSGRSRIFTGSYLGGWRRHVNLAIIRNILILTLTNNSGWSGYTYHAGFQTDNWYHIAATWDGSNVSFYVNGSKKQTDNQSLIPKGNNDPKIIGALNPPWNPEVFNGIIKDVRVYNRSLTDLEIQENYDGNVTTGSLVSWWKMNDGGDIADDTMGRNNATIYGADWINQVYHKYSLPGSYNVTLTVSNEYRQIDSITRTITII
jgi:PKD repeat protein